jgi:hypothetical protein
MIDGEEEGGGKEETLESGWRAELPGTYGVQLMLRAQCGVLGVSGNLEARSTVNPLFDSKYFPLHMLADHRRRGAAPGQGCAQHVANVPQAQVNFFVAAGCQVRRRSRLGSLNAPPRKIPSSLQFSAGSAKESSTGDSNSLDVRELRLQRSKAFITTTMASRLARSAAGEPLICP